MSSMLCSFKPLLCLSACSTTGWCTWQGLEVPSVACSLLQVWFMDSVQKVLEDLDPELPYFITDVSRLLHAAAVLGAASHCLPVL